MKKTGSLVHAALTRFLMERSKPLILSVFRQRQVMDVEGDPAEYGVRNGDFSAILELVRNLLVGADADKSAIWPLVDIGQRRHVSILWVPDKPNDHIILTDAELCGNELTERQQAANELALASAEKSKTIRELKATRDELRKKAEALAEAQKFQRRLIDTLSHDLRTPLMSIGGYATLLEPYVSSNPSASRALAAIGRNTLYLRTLAENLLQLATADAGRSELSCEPFALDQLAADIESIMRPIADGKRLKLDVNWQSTAQTMPRFDEWRLRQIALNLVSNAVRYTNEGRVDVELIYDGRQMLLRVTDTGIGIAPEFQETIFEPLNRGALHGREGAGLGLSIVRQLVDQMGGKIAVQSALGVGSRFQVSLPQTDSSAAAAGVSSEPELRLPNRRILIIDDDSDVADMLVWSLGEVGFQVRALYDPMPVDAVVKEFSPGLLIVDIELGARSGLAITQDLRVKRFAGSIIVYSGASDAATQQAAKTAGADLFLAKPVDMPKFLAWMKKLLPTA